MLPQETREGRDEGKSILAFEWQGWRKNLIVLELPVALPSRLQLIVCFHFHAAS